MWRHRNAVVMLNLNDFSQSYYSDCRHRKRDFSDDTRLFKRMMQGEYKIKYVLDGNIMESLKEYRNV